MCICSESCGTPEWGAVSWLTSCLLCQNEVELCLFFLYSSLQCLRCFFFPFGNECGFGMGGEMGRMVDCGRGTLTRIYCTKLYNFNENSFQSYSIDITYENLF